jgi:hypothetical protein
MPLTDIEVASRSCVLAGLNPISGFNNTNDEEKATEALYPGVRDQCLTSYSWRFAVKESQLDRLAVTPVSGRWEAVYDLPSDLLMLRAVTVSGYRTPYDRYAERNIYTNTSADDVVVADYVYQVDENFWPPYFTRYVELKMASVLAASITLQADLSELFERKALMQFATAKHMDGQSQTMGYERTRAPTNRFLFVRR